MGSLWGHGDVGVVGMGKGAERKGRGRKSELEGGINIHFLSNTARGRCWLLKFTSISLNAKYFDYFIKAKIFSDFQTEQFLSLFIFSLVLITTITINKR